MRNIAKCMVGLMGICLPLAAQNDFRALGWSQNTAYHSHLMREVHQQYLERQMELSGAYASEEGVREYIDGCIARYKRIAGAFPEHAFRLAADAEHLAGTLFNGDDRRFIEHDAVIAHIDEAVRRPEVDADVGGKQLCQSLRTHERVPCILTVTNLHTA